MRRDDPYLRRGPRLWLVTAVLALAGLVLAGVSLSGRGAAHPHPGYAITAGQVRSWRSRAWRPYLQYPTIVFHPDATRQVIFTGRPWRTGTNPQTGSTMKVAYDRADPRRAQDLSAPVDPLKAADFAAALLGLAGLAAAVSAAVTFRDRHWSSGLPSTRSWWDAPGVRWPGWPGR